MQTVAVTETGVKTNMCWFNDYETKESRLVHAGHLTEILDITQEQLEECDNIEELSKKYSINSSLSEERKFRNGFYIG